eukprot:11224908-Lingulodinium_polyedra.AAC.1
MPATARRASAPNGGAGGTQGGLVTSSTSSAKLNPIRRATPDGEPIEPERGLMEACVVKQEFAVWLA